MSNLAYRQDIRTPAEFERDRTRGTRSQIRLLEEYVQRHTEFVELHSKCPLKIVDFEHLADEKLNKGQHIDSLDARLLIQIRESKPFWLRVEVEHVEAQSTSARFKKDKFLRCLKYQAPILHFQIGVLCPELFIFSVSTVQMIHNRNAYKCSPKFYGGKDFYEFNTMFPEPKVASVKWPSLEPVEKYKELLKNLVGK